MKNNKCAYKKQVFVIDDDVAIRDILTSILEGEELRVGAFESGEMALGQLEEIRPDLVLLDYYLPDESTEQVINEFRRRVGKDLPILLMSAHQQAFEVARRFALNDFLAKPFQLETVLRAVRKSL